MKKIIILVLVLLVAGGGGAFLYRHFEGSEEPETELTLYGNVDIRQIRLAFQTTGRIMEMMPEEGERVEAGELLARIDAGRYQAAYDQAKARVAAQKEIVARLLAGSREEEIAAARARVEAARATLHDATEKYRRIEALAEQDSVSEQELDDARAAFTKAEALLEEARQLHTLAVKGPRREDIAAARAQLKADEAALALAGVDLADTKLHAPAGGIIQERILEPGDMAFPQTPVYTLALDNPLWIRAYVSETDLGRIAPGMRAVVSTDSFPDKRYPGWIGFISPTAEFTPKQVETPELRTKLVYRLKVFVCNSENELRLGMPVTVHVPLDQKGDHAGLDPADPCGEK